jgi:hypothetical protein
MKKYILASTIALFSVAVVTTSCNKYEDGPAFSLLTKKMRLTGDWTLENYTSDGTDITSFVQSAWGNAEWQIEKDGTYKITGNINDSGTWELGEDKDDVFFTPTGDPQESYRILRLKNTELWLRMTNANGTYDVIKLTQ